MIKNSAFQKTLFISSLSFAAICLILSILAYFLMIPRAVISISFAALIYVGFALWTAFSYRKFFSKFNRRKFSLILLITVVALCIWAGFNYSAFAPNIADGTAVIIDGQYYLFFDGVAEKIISRNEYITRSLSEVKIDLSLSAAVFASCSTLFFSAFKFLKEKDEK